MKKSAILVIVNGYPESGKDTFVDICVEYIMKHTKLCISHKYSTVDSIKCVAEILGWDGTKTPKNRAILSELKDFSTKHFNTSMNEIDDIVRISKQDNIDYGETTVTFCMVREPNQIQQIQDKYMMDEEVEVLTLFIERAVENTSDCHSDRDVEKYHYMNYIDNNGTEDQLKQLAIKYSNYICN